MPIYVKMSFIQRPSISKCRSTSEYLSFAVDGVHLRQPREVGAALDAQGASQRADPGLPEMRWRASYGKHSVVGFEGEEGGGGGVERQQVPSPSRYTPPHRGFYRIKSRGGL